MSDHISTSMLRGSARESLDCGPPEGAPTAFPRSEVVPRRLLP